MFSIVNAVGITKCDTSNHSSWAALRFTKTGFKRHGFEKLKIVIFLKTFVLGAVKSTSSLMKQIYFEHFRLSSVFR